MKTPKWCLLYLRWDYIGIIPNLEFLNTKH